MANDVPREYYCNLDASGKRRDLYERPELTHGAVEFVATPEYVMPGRPLQPPSWVFAIDVSISAPERTRVCIVTYDKAVHYYNLKHQAGPQMLVVADIDDMFVPLPDDLLVPLEPNRDSLNNLLDKIPALFSGTQVGTTSASAAIHGGFCALRAIGGRVVVFQSMLSTVGPGKLKPRDDTRLYGTEKERSLLAPQDPWYKDLARDCALNQVSVHIFLFSNNYIDTATMSALTGPTGGDLYYYPAFNAAKDAEKFQDELSRLVTRPSGFEAVMRLRCSAGLCVKEYLGNFFGRTPDDMDLANIDSDKAFAAVLKHDDKLPENSEACLQSALLYTTATGERRIRVCTVSVPVTAILGNLFRYADLDSIMNLQLRLSAQMALQHPLEKVRQRATDQCVDILYTYRKYCTNSASSGQLILPEALKLLPLYTLSILKNMAFRAGTDVRMDDRAYLIHNIMSMSAAFSTHYIYPRMFALHNLPSNVGALAQHGDVILPPTISLSSEKLDADGVFLVEDGLLVFLWIGKQVNPAWLTDVFGIPSHVSIEDVDCSQLRLVQYDNELSQRINNIVRAVRFSLPRGGSVHPVVRILKQRDALESRFFCYLLEDRHQATFSYVEYLCHVHRQIQNKFQ
eukprot:tig00000829_g4645.t1